MKEYDEYDEYNEYDDQPVVTTKPYDCDDYGEEFDEKRDIITPEGIRKKSFGENKKEQSRKSIIVKSTSVPVIFGNMRKSTDNNIKEEETEEKGEKSDDINLTNYLRWTTSPVPSPVSSPGLTMKDFPDISPIVPQKHKNTGWKRVVDKDKFTKITMTVKSPLHVYTAEYRNIDIDNIQAAKIPNLYLKNKKKSEYCYHSIKNNRCPNPNCKKAHSLEEFCPVECMLKTKEACDSCNDTNKICELKHTNEHLEDYLLRVKYITTSLYGKLMGVREENKHGWTEVKLPNMNRRRSNAIETLQDKGKQIKALSKTRLCIHWQRDGKCQRGDKCNFAHGEGELVVKACLFGINCNNPNCVFSHPSSFTHPSNPSRLKTKMCIFWQKYGKCKHGDNCRFAHGEVKKIPCRFGKNCKKQPNCTFEH